MLPVGYFEIRELAEAARLDWGSIEPAIFGSLFEGGLDPSKRERMASLFDSFGIAEDASVVIPGILAAPEADRGVGIHYTDPDTILKIIRPTVLEPLEEEWVSIKSDIAALQDKKIRAKSDSARTRTGNKIDDIYLKFRERLGKFRVLDPACGSGNFLYLSLQHLKNFDQKVMNEALDLGLPADNQRVGPGAVKGIEVNPYAAELARVTIWIGELQWQMRNASGIRRSPILSELDGIVNKDALMNSDGARSSWPEANVVVGNPPFLGNKRMIGSLGEGYTTRLRELFKGEVPGGADLVTYWFEISRSLLGQGKLERVGLVTTNSIRGGANRKILESIKTTSEIFEAWSDETWVVDGADVRVSLVAFGNHNGTIRLDGEVVPEIYSDLTGKGITHTGPDLTRANKLVENKSVAFQGTIKTGAFDIPGDLARQWIQLPSNPGGRRNSEVLRPWTNGDDITQNPSGRWVIDFGVSLPEEEAALYEAPFEYLVTEVKDRRAGQREGRASDRWWLHQRARPKMREALKGLSRYICTPRVSKYRLFVWLDKAVLPDSATVAITRDDDVTFGILHSRLHELWSLRLCTWLGVGNDPRYTPSTTFETFPFPEGLEPTVSASEFINDPRAKMIADAAQSLVVLRNDWLYPAELIQEVPEVVSDYPVQRIPISSNAANELKRRTLTELYNQRPKWLENAHRQLDDAVVKAYGWPDHLDDDSLLEQLFEMNQSRTNK